MGGAEMTNTNQMGKGAAGKTDKPSYPGRYSGWDQHTSLYEDGKHRRYELLFAVNGGAFAIGKLFADNSAERFLKHLSLNQVAVSMIVFTVMMWIDIAVFGSRMRKESGDTGRWDGTFSMSGKILLGVICLLIIGGWIGVLGLWSVLADHVLSKAQ